MTIVPEGREAADLQNRWRDRAVLFLLFALEAWLFIGYAHREILWHQPEFYDQAIYLISSYEVESGLRAGNLQAVLEGLTRQIDSALPLEGAGLALVLGGSRLPRLVVNLVLLCVAQLVVMRTVRLLTGHSLYGFAAVGLLLSQAFLFQPAGGLFDFRFDLAAACLYGIWLCSLLCAGRRSLAKGLALTMLAALALLLHRLVAGLQMLPVLVVLTLLAAVSFIRHRTPDRLLRLQHAVSSLFLTFIMLAAYVALRWKAISDYYVEGHLVGDEKIARAHELGLFDLAGHLWFYPVNLAQQQLGTAFVVLAGLGLLVAAAFASGGRRQAVPIATCAAAAILPLAALAIDVSKSPVVASITCLPCVLLVCLICFAPGEKRRVAQIAIALVFIAGGCIAAAARLREPVFTAARPHYEAVTDLAREVVRQIDTNSWPAPVYLSVDAMTSRINVPALDSFIYEQTGKLHHLQMGLGARVDAFDVRLMEAELARSKLLITTPYAGVGSLPFDKSMKALQATFEAQVAEKFQPIATFGTGADEITLHARRPAPIGETRDTGG